MPAKAVAKVVAKKAPAQPNAMFPSRPKSNRIGGDVRPQGRDLSRFVRWPKYVRIQRQKKILLQRLKVPPALNQFKSTLDKNQAAELFKLLVAYQPESKADKEVRINNLAQATAKGEAAPSTEAPIVLKYGLKHVTTLIEQKKAKLVCIAHDVNPIELVVWLPALCRKMNIPYCIVKGKSRLGTLTHKKNCAVCCITAVRKEDASKLATLQQNFKEQFNLKVDRKWGGGTMGLKTQAKLEKRRIFLEAEEAKKALTRR